MSCYNGSRWLQEAIDSVLSQSFADFELLIVNDGSTDGTLQILEENRKRDSRVKMLNKAHTGLTDSLNFGLAAAGGRWIARLDSDDLCEPDRLIRQVEFAGRNNTVLLGSGFIEMDDAGCNIKTHYYPHQHHRLIRHLERSKRFFPHSSALFDRRVAAEVGGYNPRFRKSQDRDLWARLAESGRIACLDRALVRVRKHPANISSSTAGHSQFVYGTLASSCFILRARGVTDPSSSDDDSAWEGFLEWAAKHPATVRDSARRLSWAEARNSYFARRNRLFGLMSFAWRLLISGAATGLTMQKLLGSALPARLANEWVKRQCVES